MISESLTIPALLRRNGEYHRAQAAIVAGERSISHAGLDLHSTTVARGLVGAGMDKSSRVGLLMESGIEWAVIAAAVMRTGAVLVPLSTLLTPPELRNQLRVAAVTELIVTRQFSGRHYLADLDVIAPGIKALTVGGGRHSELPNLRRVWPADDLPSRQVEAALVTALGDTVRAADDLVVIFTYGSRGTARGTIHTHGGAIWATAAGLASRGVGTEARLHIQTPFFSTGGFSDGLMTVLVAGATVITEAIPEPESTVDVERDGANGFAMTETFGPYCGERVDRGRPFPGVEVRIFDLGSGAECPPGTYGEIGVRGRSVMRGICGLTREETFDADGFYHTGDVGRLDTDGYLWSGAAAGEISQGGTPN